MIETRDSIKPLKREYYRIITLTTDFGTKDPYVSSMKGVILSIAPEAIIIDITHEVEPFNVLQGAFILYQAARWFPARTIHVAVIDPGVGSERKAVAIKTKNCTLIGPDNGVLMPTANYFDIVEARDIKKSFFENVSYTFHGRDLFAPAAASLLIGMKFEDLGPKATSLKTLDFGKIKWTNGRLEAKVLHVDRFGNVITNIPRDLYLEISSEKRIAITTNKKTLPIKPAFSYFEGKPLELLLLPGSGDFVEISCNKGSAADLLDIKPSDTFILKFGSSF
ncbi:MAG TPA: hypothetical protein EYP68_02400 [Candidatus Korarchaeota archaeon]|nr:hypothetical protein [Candidatus Korarchaeota archaeon]